ncbi:CoxG family protein [Hansschlegelia quercus]|uniref:Carbon monoxide dehydrogenase n=1 Tax=Hansschlegelia quercus TaxID=2528245 RepID=A0A4Q9GAX3_9HYPH|nr:carbon monoxide dehydrogenase subunit G [Hansschlegelia quercus]TBN48258.1 carbon monoxide dehydrogenase [Hansschlegelia quercus]
MEFSGSHRINAPRETVWAALADPALIRECAPGCTRLETNGDGFDAAAEGKVGPVRATFSGRLSRVDEAAPERFSLIGDGDAGAAGSAKGRADVTLTEEGGATLVSYKASGEVGGKIGQLGSRLVTGFGKVSAEATLAAVAARLDAGYAASPKAPPLAEAPPLVYEEPAEGPAVLIAETPPITGGPTPIAPTAVPMLTEPEAIGASEVVEPGSTGASVAARVTLVAAIVLIVGAVAYYLMFQAPPV